MKGWVYIETGRSTVCVRVSAILYVSSVVVGECFVALSNGEALRCDSGADEVERKIAQEG